MVVFATPGMLHAGLSLQVFKKWAPDENNMLIMPGLVYFSGSYYFFLGKCLKLWLFINYLSCTTSDALVDRNWWYSDLRRVIFSLYFEKEITQQPQMSYILFSFWCKKFLSWPIVFFEWNSVVPQAINWIWWKQELRRAVLSLHFEFTHSVFTTEESLLHWTKRRDFLIWAQFRTETVGLFHLILF